MGFVVSLDYQNGKTPARKRGQNSAGQRHFSWGLQNVSGYGHHIRPLVKDLGYGLFQQGLVAPADMQIGNLHQANTKILRAKVLVQV